MRSPLALIVGRFNRQLQILADNIAAELQAKITPETTEYELDKIILEALKGAKYSEKLKQALIAGIVESVSAGIGGRVREPVAFKRWYLENAWNASGVQFSASLNDLGRTDEMVYMIRNALKAGQGWRQAAQFLSYRGIQKADVGQYVQEVNRRARQAFSAAGDSTEAQKYVQSVRRAKANLDKLVDPSTSKLRRAYQDVLDAADAGSAKALDKAIEQSVYFKQRYNSERIARTEMARAYGQAFFTSNLDDDDAIGYRSVLSSAHKVPDICDFHAKADLYGMGRGVYPKDHGPPYPYHPHCVLPGSNIQYFGDLRRCFKSFYSGTVIEIATASGKRFAVTRNHPIMTCCGWVVADELRIGDKVVSGEFSQGPMLGMNPYNQHIPSTIEQIFSSLQKSIGVSTRAMPASAVDFHGDGRFVNGDIDIIDVDGLLHRWLKSEADQLEVEDLLNVRNPDLLEHFAFRNPSLDIEAFFSASYSSMSGFREALVSLRSSKLLLEKVGSLSDSAPLDISFYEPLSDNISANPVEVRNGLLALSRHVAFDNIINIKSYSYSGHVYDLQVDPYQIYICNGVVVKNCTCILEPIYSSEATPPDMRQPDQRQAVLFLEQMPEPKRVALLGVAGNEAFKEDPYQWQSYLKNWQPHESKRPTIPMKLLAA